MSGDSTKSVSYGPLVTMTSVLAGTIRMRRLEMEVEVIVN